MHTDLMMSSTNCIFIHAGRHEQFDDENPMDRATTIIVRVAVWMDVLLVIGETSKLQ